MSISLHETKQNTPDVAVLVSLVTSEVKRSGIDPAYSLDELVQLAQTAGVEVAEIIVQNKDKPDFRWFIGKGKVEELRTILEDKGANTVIFDQELSGAQVRNLEQQLDVKIIDRQRYSMPLRRLMYMLRTNCLRLLTQLHVYGNLRMAKKLF